MAAEVIPTLVRSLRMGPAGGGGGGGGGGLGEGEGGAGLCLRLRFFLFACLIELLLEFVQKEPTMQSSTRNGCGVLTQMETIRRLS